MLEDLSSTDVCGLCGFQQHKCIAELREANSLSTINKCLRCKNAWTNPAPSRLSYESKDFHKCSLGDSSSEHIKTMEDLPLEWRTSMQMQISLIEKHLNSGSRVLEIGCGEGILLSELSKSGFVVEGIEPSLTASKRAANKDLNISACSFPDNIPSNLFDLIILSHVLEHIENPHIFIQEVVKLIPNGYLLVVQTNHNGLIPSLRPKSWYAWVPEEHYWHFTPAGLSYFLEKYMLSQIACEYSSLVHSENKNKVLQLSSLIFPSLADQFHSLFKFTAN